jgi:hypothetical protein
MIYNTGPVVPVAILCILQKAHAAAPAEWRGRSIYQIFTDRFATTAGSIEATCAPGYGGYCGGTWKGIISKLDYIQVMIKSTTSAFKFLMECLLGNGLYGYLDISRC